MKGSCPGLIRWMKFNLVGLIGIGVQLLLLFVLKTILGLNYLVATALAVEAAVLHNFLWHEAFTWSDRKVRDRIVRFIKFNLTTGIFSIAGNLVFTRLLVEIGVDYLAANGMSIVLCSIINFFLTDRLVFRLSSGQTFPGLRNQVLKPRVFEKINTTLKRRSSTVA
jgi:putative flippase GtrA